MPLGLLEAAKSAIGHISVTVIFGYAISELLLSLLLHYLLHHFLLQLLLKDIRLLLLLVIVVKFVIIYSLSLLNLNFGQDFTDLPFVVHPMSQLPERLRQHTCRDF